MINWIIGGIIVALTAIIIIRSVVRMKKGQSSCCGDCSQSKCNCDHKP